MQPNTNSIQLDRHSIEIKLKVKQLHNIILNTSSEESKVSIYIRTRKAHIFQMRFIC